MFKVGDLVEVDLGTTPTKKRWKGACGTIIEILDNSYSFYRPPLFKIQVAYLPPQYKTDPILVSYHIGDTMNWREENLLLLKAEQLCLK